MTLTQRRIYYLIITILFLGLAPLVFFLTSGYRFDLHQAQFIKTGLIIIDSNPTNSLITVNEEMRGKTPGRIANLTPGIYQVSLQKDGYRTWHSAIPVFSNQSTIVGKPFLFLEKPVRNAIANGEVGGAWTGNGQSDVAYVMTEQPKTLWLTTSDISAQAYQVSAPIESVSWSPNDSHILVTTTDGGHFATSVDHLAEMKAVPRLDEVLFQSLVWKNETQLVSLVDERVYLIDLPSGNISLLKKSDVTAITVVGENVWTVLRDGRLTMLDQSGSARLTYQLPRTGYVFGTNNKPGAVSLYHPQHAEILLLVSSRLLRIPLTIIPQQVSWNPIGSAVMLANGTELWSIARNNQYAPELLERTSNLAEALWFQSGSISYRQGSEIKVIDTSPIRAHQKETLLNESGDIRLIGTTKNSVLFTTTAAPAGIYRLTVM